MFTVKVEIEKSRVYDLLITGVETSFWVELEGDWEQAWKDAEKPGVRSAFGLIKIRDNYKVTEDGMAYNDSERRSPVALNDTQLEQGIKLMQEKYPEHFADFIEEREDAETGDVFLQCIMFEEVIYG